MSIEPHLAVRAASIYLAATSTLALILYRRRGRSWFAPALLAFTWNLPMLLALNVLADRIGWWHFEATGGLLLGVPVDLWLSWAWMWGAVPAIAFPRLRLGWLTLAALAIDLVLMPMAEPVVHLEPRWLIGEAVAIGFAFLPGQLLARWTLGDRRLVGRACLQIVAFTGLTVFLLPAIAIEGSGSTFINPLGRPIWQLSLIAQLIALPAMLGLSAVQEFVTRGRGTPVPYDPPKQLVSTGPYAYIRNPMQTSAVVLLVLLGAALNNVWVAVAGLMAHIYSIGIAGWDEEEDLRRRFGWRWAAYRHGVRPWIPRLRPWHAPYVGAGCLYVSSECGKCREVGAWFRSKAASDLIIVAAESHHSRALTRITYEPGDGSAAESGVGAIARALEHIHLGWALVGFCLRLPVVRPVAQLLVDASGGEPRRLAQPASPPAEVCRTPKAAA